MEFSSLKQLLECYPGLAIVLDAAGGVLYQNSPKHPFLRRLARFTQLDGCSDSRSDEPDYALHLRQHLHRLITSGSDQCELESASEAEAHQVCHANGYAINLNDGQSVFVCQMSLSAANPERDSTERRNRILLALSEITEKMIQQQSLDTLLQMVAERLIDLTSASSTFIHLVHPDEHCLKLVAAAGQELAPLGQKLQPGQGMAGKSWQTGQLVYIDDYSQYGSRLSSIANVKQASAIPMFMAEEVTGVLGIMFIVDEESIEDQLDVLQKFANLASVAIQNAQLIEQTHTELARAQHMNKLAQRLPTCESVGELLEATAYCVIKHFGVQSIDAWTFRKGATEHLLGAWESDRNHVVALEKSRQQQLKSEVNQWFETQPRLVRSFNTLGFVSTPMYQLAEFDHAGSAVFALLDHGEAWCMLRIHCDPNKPGFDSVHNLLLSVVTQLSTAARLLRLLNNAQFRAEHDELTGLCNKFGFNAQLETYLTDVSASNGSLGVFFIDLDGFKAVNDSLGHAIGDRLLQLVSVRFSAALRDECLLARLGGDEFAVLVPNTSRAESMRTAMALLGALETPFELQGTPVVGASIGIVVEDRQNKISSAAAAELIQRADQAMYTAKNAGKGRIHFACGYTGDADTSHHSSKQDTASVVALAAPVDQVVRKTS